MNMYSVRSWSTGQPQSLRFNTLREATDYLRGVRASYFNQVWYISKGAKKSHKYTIPAAFTFQHFCDNITDYVTLTALLVPKG